MELTTLWHSVSNMKNGFKKVSTFHNSSVSHCWSLFFCLLSVNEANVFCMKPPVTHSRLLTSHALSTNRHISYTHIICAGWLQVDRCMFSLPSTVGGWQLNVNTCANNSLQSINFSMFYLWILSCYISYSLVHLSVLPSFPVSQHVSPDSLWVSLTFMFLSLQRGVLRRTFDRARLSLR